MENKNEKSKGMNNYNRTLSRIRRELEEELRSEFIEADRVEEIDFLLKRL